MAGAVVWLRLLVGCAAILGAALSQQPALVQLRVEVLDAATRSPVPGAAVILHSTSLAVRREVVTPSSGTVLFEVPTGRYSLLVRHNAYLSGFYGQRSAGDLPQPLSLTDLSRPKQVVMLLWRPGIVSGSLEDDSDEPIAGAEVRALKKSFKTGRLRYVTAATTRTDDRGGYRFSSLTPGLYVIAAVSSAAPRPSRNDIEDPRRPSPSWFYPTVFYPGVSSTSGAVELEVDSGTSYSRIDFETRPAEAGDLQGIVIGQSPCTVIIELRDQATEELTDLPFPKARCSASGAFKFSNLPPGQYRVRVVDIPQQQPSLRPDGSIVATRIEGRLIVAGGYLGELPFAPIQSRTTLWAEAEARVAPPDPHNPQSAIRLQLAEGTSIAGRLVFVGKEPPSRNRVFMAGVEVRDADGHELGPTPVVPVEPDGTFETIGLPPGRYFVDVTPGWPDWFLRSRQIQGRDFSTSPIDLRVLSDAAVRSVVVEYSHRQIAVSGTVRSVDGRLSPDATVFFFPSDARYWADLGESSVRHGRIRTDEDAVFQANGALPGEYCFVATSSSAGLAGWTWGDPDFLRALAPGCTRVSVDVSNQDILLTARALPKR